MPLRALTLGLLLGPLNGCGALREDDGRDSAASVSEPPPTVADWTGHYALRGTIDRSRQATGMLSADQLVPGASHFTATRERVRRSYPEYDGPFYLARLAIVTDSDTTSTELTCAHGPAEPPPLVCEPVTPMAGLTNASLVMRPDGTALVTGSHGEGVRVDYAHLRWTRE